MSDPQIPESVKEAAAHLKPTPYDWREPAKDKTFVCKSCQARLFFLIVDDGKARALSCATCLKAFMLREDK